MDVLWRASTSTVRCPQLLLTRTFASSSISLKRSKSSKLPKAVPFNPANRTPTEWRESLNDQENALVSSTPLKVRERRAARRIPDEKMVEDGVTIVNRLEYEKRRARGDFLDTHLWLNGEPTPREWVDFMNTRRNRIRGRKLVTVSPTEDADVDADANAVADPDLPLAPPRQVEEIVGRPVYLPSIVMRLIPNHTPPGQPYNPWEATFYIPHHGVTKTDIRSYLWAMYGLEVTYIRTDNYYPQIRARPGMQTKRYNKGIALKSRKRAVVGLKSPFIFPNMREDMTSEEREAQNEVLDAEVGFTAQLEDQKRYLRREQGLEPDPWNNRVMGKKNVMRDRKERRDDAESNIQRAVHSMINAAVEAGTHGKTSIRPDQIPLPEK